MTAPSDAPAAAFRVPEVRPHACDALLLGLIARHTDTVGWCRLGQGSMAAVLGVARLTVIRALARLARLGYVEREACRRADGGKAPGRTRLAPHVTLGLVAALVAGEAGIPAELIIASRARRREVALARQIVMYLAAVDLELSQETVGRALGRDRTTVSHALGRIEDRRDDGAFDAMLAALEARVARVLGPMEATAG